MRPAPYRNDVGQARLFFILSLWLSLGVALLSALAPLGPPSSRLMGSAFNPATTSVVLKARGQANPIVIRVIEPDGDGRAPTLAPAAIRPPAMAVLLPAVLVFQRVRRIPSFHSLPSFHLLSLARARAPPAFF
ncbi:hypothetical protein [Sphingobium estronivorans]|uniref:hypothetical protein n=1 Tax=Sphingobium estronivorans TaxID=1577690 RepID=UPI001F07D36E|nr:hypothetical protein [Sphingobium estronivorans]